MFSYRNRNLTKTEVTLHNLKVSPENAYLYHRTWRNLPGIQLEALTSHLVFNLPEEKISFIFYYHAAWQVIACCKSLSILIYFIEIIFQAPWT